MPSTIRTTGSAFGIYNPATDTWVTDAGPWVKLKAMCLWDDRDEAIEVMEAFEVGQGLILVSVDLSLDSRATRMIDTEYLLRHPADSGAREGFKGG